MAKGNKCRISNCKNIITYKGNVCGTHQWRQTKFNSYDLPSHTGEPSYYVHDDPFPEGIVKKCEIHGFLNDDQVYNRIINKKIVCRYCKQCTLSANIRRKYQGMNDLNDYDKLLKLQNDSCAMCKGQNQTTRNGKIKRFSIDHCHKTGKVRGLLCSFCNSLIGYAKDDTTILQAAIDYLKASEN